MSFYSELSDSLQDHPEFKGRAFGSVFAAQTIGGAVLGLISGYLSTASGFLSPTRQLVF